MLNYLIKDCIEFKCGFPLTCHDVVKAIDDTNQHLGHHRTNPIDWKM